MRSAVQALLSVALLAATHGAAAQAYPTKPVRLLIAQAPGSATDIISRVVAPPLSQLLGQPVVVEARPGGGGSVGTAEAARSAPDGYTLFMGNNSTHGSNPALYAKLPYDAVNDFAPISFVAQVPYAMVVNTSLPANSVGEFIALVKSRPGKMNYASAGNGSTHHFCGELLKTIAGIDMLHVPYKGSPPGMTAVLANEVAMMFVNLADIGPHIKSGKVKALGVTAAKRSFVYTDIPTLAEAGVKDFEVTSWFGLLVPKATPGAIVSRLNAEMVKVLALPEVRDTLGKQALEVSSSTPEQFAAHIRSEIARFSRIAKAANIRAE